MLFWLASLLSRRGWRTPARTMLGLAEAHAHRGDFLLERKESRPWVENEISFERWRAAERVILRGIARRVQGLLQERNDPALVESLEQVRALVAEWQAWRTYGLNRGWQP